MLGIRNGSSRLGIGNVGVQTMFVAWNRKRRSSSQVRNLESEMEEFEPSSRLGIRNGGVRAQFRYLEFEMEEFEPSTDNCNWERLSSRLVPSLGSGNGGVRAKLV